MKMLSILSQRIHLGPMICLLLMKSAPYRYKKFCIKKRDGNERVIAQPTPAIKALQNIAIQEFLNKLPIHQSAIAYRKRMGIKNNALAHVKNKYLLKLDFKDFFHSIIPSDLDKLNMHKFCNLSEEEVELLKLLFFWRPIKKSEFMCLSIGAPSSPYLSNIIMHDIDLAIYNLCLSHGAIYTRYSDDITISTSVDNELNSIFDEVKLICNNIKSPNLKLNAKKTVFASKKNNRTVTGIVITNNETISLGRDRKRMIRAMIHNLIINRSSDPESINKVNGYIAFAHDIEPEFIVRLERTYETDRDVLKNLGVRLFLSG